jgi:hypothetical protein
LVIINQLNAIIGIDLGSISTYSDLVFLHNYWNNLNYNVNRRLLINPKTKYSCFQKNLIINHNYKKTGKFSIMIYFNATKQIFNKHIQIHSSKNELIKTNKTSIKNNFKLPRENFEINYRKH